MCFVRKGARKADGDGGASAAARTRERFFLFRYFSRACRLDRVRRRPTSETTVVERRKVAADTSGDVLGGATGRAVATLASAFPAETGGNRVGDERAETYRLARTVPWPRRRRRGPSPARLPSRWARFCRESRTSSSALFHVARNPGSARATRRFERRGACTRRTVCVRRTRTSTRGANTARGSPAPHARSRSPRSSCRRINRGRRFSPGALLHLRGRAEAEACGCRARNAPGLNARVGKTANAWRCRTRLCCEMRGAK